LGGAALAAGLAPPAAGLAAALAASLLAYSLSATTLFAFVNNTINIPAASYLSKISFLL